MYLTRTPHAPLIPSNEVRDTPPPERPTVMGNWGPTTSARPAYQAGARSRGAGGGGRGVGIRVYGGGEGFRAALNSAIKSAEDEASVEANGGQGRGCGYNR